MCCVQHEKNDVTQLWWHQWNDINDKKKKKKEPYFFLDLYKEITYTLLSFDDSIFRDRRQDFSHILNTHKENWRKKKDVDRELGDQTTGAQKSIDVVVVVKRSNEGKTRQLAFVRFELQKKKRVFFSFFFSFLHLLFN